MFSPYLTDIIIMLMAAVIAVPLSQAARLGAVPGFLLAGVLVGPYGLALITNVTEIANFAEIGVVFLLFVIGIELKPNRLWQMRRLVFGLGSLQLLLTGLAIGGVAYALFNVPVRATLLIGPALALSSTAFVLQILSEQKLLTSLYGRTAFSVLLLQDLAVVPLLALIPLLAQPELTLGQDIGLALGETVLILVAVVLIGRYLLNPLLHRIALAANPELFTATAVLLVLGTALVTEHIGLSMAMGAFIAGLLISGSPYRHQVMAEIQPFRGLLLGVFFMSMGMSINLRLLLSDPLLMVGLVGLLVTIKALLLYPLVRLFGRDHKNGIAVSLVLAQGGEFGLVLFSLAFQSQVVSYALFQQLLLVVLLSMLITPALAGLARHISHDSESTTATGEELPDEAPIVIAGFGRIGHRIGQLLAISHRPFVALDANPAIVERERVAGHPVFYGDVRKPELLKTAGAADAQAVIVTLNDPVATEEVVTSLRQRYPDIDIYVRGHSLEQCRTLKRLGASHVVSENIEASLELARLALIKTGSDEEQLGRLLDEFRSDYRMQIDERID